MLLQSIPILVIHLGAHWHVKDEQFAPTCSCFPLKLANERRGEPPCLRSLGVIWIVIDTVFLWDRDYHVINGALPDSKRDGHRDKRCISLDSIARPTIGSGEI